MDRVELKPAQKALQKVSTKEYHQKYLKGFKNLARVNDEVLNGEYEDEEDDVVGVNALDIPCYALHNQGFFNGYESGLKDCKPNWTSCLDELPDPKVGKVLIHRIATESQKNMSISIVDASILKHCNKEETHWMLLPIFEI